MLPFRVFVRRCVRNGVQVGEGGTDTGRMRAAEGGKEVFGRDAVGGVAARDGVGATATVLAQLTCVRRPFETRRRRVARRNYRLRPTRPPLYGLCSLLLHCRPHSLYWPITACLLILTW